MGAWRSAERAADPRHAAVLLETLGRLLRGCLGAVQGWGRGAVLQGSVPPPPQEEKHIRDKSCSRNRGALDEIEIQALQHQWCCRSPCERNWCLLGLNMLCCPAGPSSGKLAACASWAKRAKQDFAGS